MKGFATLPPSSSYVAPTACPLCQSTKIVTRATSPDADSYWRCTNCGDIWNAARIAIDRDDVYRWR